MHIEYQTLGLRIQRKNQFLQIIRGFTILVYPNFKNKFSYISVTDEASDFKFGKPLGFTKAHHKISRKTKSGRGPGLGELPKILRFPFNISAAAEANDFKFGMLLGFAKGHHKITPRDKVGVAMG